MINTWLVIFLLFELLIRDLDLNMNFIRKTVNNYIFIELV